MEKSITKAQINELLQISGALGALEMALDKAKEEQDFEMIGKVLNLLAFTKYRLNDLINDIY